MLKLSELVKASAGNLIRGDEGLIIKSFSSDSRMLKRGECFIAIRGDNFDGHSFINEAVKKGASCVIAERGAEKGVLGKCAFIEVDDTLKAMARIANFNRDKCNCPVIAVTGSNGKTTTKEMIAAVLSPRFDLLKNEGTKNNHIGLPMSLLQLNASHEIGVFELGTNHFGEIGYLARICSANIGVITNIGQSHLEYFKDLSGVFREKYTLISNLRAPHLAILNNDDPMLRKIVRKKSKRPFVLSFGISERSDFTASEVKFSQGKVSFLVNKKCKITLNTCGFHNVYNALAATAVARVFGMSYKQIAGKLSEFDFPKGRLKIIKSDNALFIDDTYNSNPFSFGSAMEALENFSKRGRRIVVMGDMLELGQDMEAFHRQAGVAAAEVCDILVTVGSLSKFAAQSARARGFDNVFTCETTAEAREILFQRIAPRENDVILIKGSRAMKMEDILLALNQKRRSV